MSDVHIDTAEDLLGRYPSFDDFNMDQQAAARRRSDATDPSDDDIARHLRQTREDNETRGLTGGETGVTRADMDRAVERVLASDPRAADKIAAAKAQILKHPELFPTPATSEDFEANLRGALGLSHVFADGKLLSVVEDAQIALEQGAHPEDVIDRMLRVGVNPVDVEDALREAVAEEDADELTDALQRLRHEQFEESAVEPA